MRTCISRPLFGVSVHLAPASGTRAPYQGLVHAVVRRRRTGEPDLGGTSISAHRPRYAAATLSRASAVRSCTSYFDCALTCSGEPNAAVSPLRAMILAGDPQTLDMAMQ